MSGSNSKKHDFLLLLWIVLKAGIAIAAFHILGSTLVLYQGF